jgi:hypothetical protein
MSITATSCDVSERGILVEAAQLSPGDNVRWESVEPLEEFCCRLLLPHVQQTRILINSRLQFASVQGYGAEYGCRHAFAPQESVWRTARATVRLAPES